jgi:hypothetical protein
MDIILVLSLLQKQIAQQLGYKVDLYYMEGYGALAVKCGVPFRPMYVEFAFPDLAIKGWTKNP